MDVTDHLEAIGFKPLEGKIYLYLLQNGSSSQQEISDNKNILRQTVYELVTKMEHKGFISSSLIKKRKVYSAIDPKLLLHKIKEKEEQFMTIIPTLEKLSYSEKPALHSETFIGVDGLKNLFTMTLDSSSDLLWLANEQAHNELFKDYYWLNYGKKRSEKKVPIKLLVNADAKIHLWKTQRKELREVRKIAFVNNIYSSFVAYDDKIIIYSVDKQGLQGVFIQNKELQKLFVSIFNNLWKDAKIV